MINALNPTIVANPTIVGNPLIGPSYPPLLPAARAAASARVSEEFLTIFYKELLKQVIKTPNLSFGEEKESNNFTNFNSDLMVEQLAQQLAKNAAFTLPWLSSGEKP
jgi:hypothetical protein